MGLDTCLKEMREMIVAGPKQAIRSQSFIKRLHHEIAEELRCRLSKSAVRNGVEVVEEVLVYGSHKNKDVDIGVVHPTAGPLMLVGVRSQMSSIGKNALTYYQDIVGECISLQDRYPLSTFGYVYLHPWTSVISSSDGTVFDSFDGPELDALRWAKMYDAISGRTGRDFGTVKGVYDEFAYLVVDFRPESPVLMDDLIRDHVELDLSIRTFVNRLVRTFNRRTIWMDVFNDPDLVVPASPAGGGSPDGSSQDPVE